jgi:hypothetical protein
MSMRGKSRELISLSRMGWLRLSALLCLTVLAAERAAMEPLSLAMRISLNVFHCPHAGHLPIHFALSCPQFEQTYAILSFAMFG